MVKADKCMGVSKIVEGRARTPPKSTPMDLPFFFPAVMSANFPTVSMCFLNDDDFNILAVFFKCSCTQLNNQG